MSTPSPVHALDQATGMSQLVHVQDANGYSRAPKPDPAERGRWLSSQLEAGNILLFPSTPFPFPPT